MRVNHHQQTEVIINFIDIRINHASQIKQLPQLINNQPIGAHTVCFRVYTTKNRKITNNTHCNLFGLIESINQLTQLIFQQIFFLRIKHSNIF